MHLLDSVVKNGRLLKSITKVVKPNKSDGFIAEVLVDADTPNPTILKVYSKNPADFQVDDKGLLNIPIRFSDFCFSAI